MGRRKMGLSVFGSGFLASQCNSQSSDLTLLPVRFLPLLRMEKMTGSGSVSNFVIEHANQAVVVVKE